VIPPDQIHLFVAGPDDFNLGKWVGTLKRVLGGAIATGRSQNPIWQRGFFDHLLRSEESYTQTWDYVRENPVRAQLVGRVEDWPYAGELITIYGDQGWVGLLLLNPKDVGARCTVSRRARRLQICLSSRVFCSCVALRSVDECLTS
jgi:hypothetical protein